MIEIKVVVIGAGPAGLTAAMQLCRYRIPFVLLEKERAGGLLWEANLVENYPGFPAGVGGAKLAHLMVTQAERIGVQLSKERVLRVATLAKGEIEATLPKTLIAASASSKMLADYRPQTSGEQVVGVANFEETNGVLRSKTSRFQTKSRPKGSVDSASDKHPGRFLILTDQNEYCASYVIVATGTAPRPLPLLVPPECTGLVYSSILPLLAVSDKQTLIVGAGDAAFDYALRLAKNRNSVTILNRGREVKCLQLLWERASSHPAIAYRAAWPLVAVEAGETVDRLRVRGEAGQALEADFLLFAIGRVPQANFLSTEWLAHPPAGLFLVGDVRNGLYRQAAIAAGEGLRAAMHIYFDMETDTV
ncbi:MAG: hypothetical protein Fur0043_20030 [Anaerolineales bacterium]